MALLQRTVITYVAVAAMVAALLPLLGPGETHAATGDTSIIATNLDLAGGVGPAADWGFSFPVWEGGQGAGGTDLNGDGDMSDEVIHVWDAATDTIINLGQDGGIGGAADWGFGFAVVEGRQGAGGTDLNGDGDRSDVVAHVWDAANGKITNLGLAGFPSSTASSGFSFIVQESAQGGTDLNGDGDVFDDVIHVWAATTATAMNLGLAGGPGSAADWGLSFTVSEGEQGAGGTDLNGDGDTGDAVVHVWDAATGATSNLRLSTGVIGPAADWGFGFGVLEGRQGAGGTDLNGDGDTNDHVAHVWGAATGTTINLALSLDNQVGSAAGWGFSFTVFEGAQGAGGTDLNGDGDTFDDVIHVWDAATGTVTNLGQDGGTGSAAGWGFASLVSESGQGNTDLNGDGDTNDHVIHVWDAATGTVTNLGQDGGTGSAAGWGFSLFVREFDQGVGGTDLNGDGDTSDRIVHVWDVATNTIGNLGLAIPTTLSNSAAADWGFDFSVSEGAQGGTDLNGDGDTADWVLHRGRLNGAPVANPDSYITAEGQTLLVNGVLDNDSDPDGDALTAVEVTPPAQGTLILDPDGSFTYEPDLGYSGPDAFTYVASDGQLDSSPATVSLTVEPSGLHTVGLVDPASGQWHLRDEAGQVTVFFYGDPGDAPFVGDWDCDGDDTPGLFRQSDAFVYLSNANRSQVADIRFFFGNPGDMPIVGDFNGDGCDTVSIYRPSEGRFFIINKLGQNEGGLGAAETDYLFGNPGDKPFVGDFDGDGVETVGLHRETTGLVYFRNTHTQGIADALFTFGDPGDRLVAGDWGIVDGVDTPALFRPSNTTFFFRHTNTVGIADSQFVFGETAWLPVAGAFGLD